MTWLLDTGVWLRAYAEPDSLPPAVLGLLRQSDGRFGLSAISLWEVGKKNQLGKLPLPTPLTEWFQRALGQDVEVLPITPEVVTEAMSLPDFPNRDPGDELIVATARVHGLTLLTTDTLLRKYRHAQIRYFTPILRRK